MATFYSRRSLGGRAHILYAFDAIQLRDCACDTAFACTNADPDSTNPAVKRDYFLRREFTFTMADDVYIRYLCFRDQLAFEKAVNSKQPHKIDIGPVYTAPVR